MSQAAWADQRQIASHRDPVGRELGISYVDLKPDLPAWSAPVVFIHGAGGYFAQWTRQLEFFSGRARSLAFDLRGHGESGKPEWASYSLDEFAEDLLAVLEAAAIEEPIYLVGHSFGGAVATHFTARYPQRVAKLALLSTTGTLPVDPSILLLLKMPKFILDPIQRAFHDRVGAPVHVLKKLVPNVRNFDGWALYPRLALPTLAMCGELDLLTRPKYVRRMAEAIAGARYEAISFARHLPQIERPKRVNEALLAFLGGDSRLGMFP